MRKSPKELELKACDLLQEQMNSLGVSVDVKRLGFMKRLKSHLLNIYSNGCPMQGQEAIDFYEALQHMDNDFEDGPEVIEALCCPKDLFPDVEDGYELWEIFNEISDFRRIPDAHFFLSGEQAGALFGEGGVSWSPRYWNHVHQIVIVEVEDSHQTPKDKIAEYRELWFFFDCMMHIEFQVLVVDRFLNVSSLDLLGEWWKSADVDAQKINDSRKTA